jgi:hypothetical protein
MQFTPHDLRDDNHERQVESKVQALLETTDKNLPQRIRPCDIQKLIKSLKLRKACGIDGILNECHRHLPRRPLVHVTHLFNHYLRLSHFPNPWKEEKAITLSKPGKELKSGHEPQTGLDTKTDRLTDRRSQCDSDSDSD